MKNVYFACDFRMIVTGLTVLLMGVSSLLGTCTVANAGKWEVTATSTNSASSPSVSSQTAIVATSKKTAVSLATSAQGATTSNLTNSAQASYSGTWTVRWIPDNSTDWPGASTIKSIKSRSCVAMLRDASGTALVKVTGGSNLVSALGPTTATAITSLPLVTTSTDTSTSNLTVTTYDLSQHLAKATASGWQDSTSESTIKIRAYAAAYFPAHYTAPADIEMTFTVTSVNLTASVDFAGTSSTSLMSAFSGASEIYTATED